MPSRDATNVQRALPCTEGSMSTNDSASHDVVRDQNPTDVRLTTERKAQLAALVELDREMTVDEAMYMVGLYESLATRIATQRRQS